MRRTRTFAARLALIAGLGLALRVAYVLLLADDVTGSGDYHFYHGVANLLAEGHGFSDPFAFVAEHGVEHPTATHPPLWPALLSLASLAGATGEVSHKLVGCLVGAAVIVAVGMLGRRIGGPRLGLIAAALAAVYPVLVTADGALMSEPLYGLFIALALLAAHTLLERPAPGWAALLGAVVALAALTRSEALLLLPLLLAPAALSGPGPGRARWLRLAAGVGACLLVLAPWTLRNWSAFDRFVLISTNDGTMLAGANCPPSYHGPNMGGWDFECISKVRPGEDDAERSRRWRREGLEYARDNAGRLPIVIPVRVLRTWELWQPLEQVQFAEGRYRPLVRVGVAWYFALLPLAGLGVLALRGRRELWLLLAPVAMVVVTSAVGYGVPRLRHAAEIPLVVLAAVGIERIQGWLSSPSAIRRPDRTRAGRVTAGSSQSQSRAAWKTQAASAAAGPAVSPGARR
jgi:4-amino-4-deoxy-L-arabinose transferase-like glycosyltransferase